MRSIYRSVDDIDLFPAGIAERPVPGALLGHTFLCIVGDQFARLKKGDRFFYDLGGQPHSFTEGKEDTSEQRELGINGERPRPPRCHSSDPWLVRVGTSRSFKGARLIVYASLHCE